MSKGARASTAFSKVVLIFALAIIHLRTSFGFSAVAPPRVKDTKVSVDGKSTVAIVPPPNQALSGNVTLTDYMQLPVAQYVLIPMPMGSSLTRMDDNCDGDFSSDSADDTTEFELVVPNITFFKMIMQPVVYATVQPQKNRVVISSTKCILRGSSFIERVELNDRFDFSVNTTLTWEDALVPQTNQARDVNQDGCVEDDATEDNSICCSITAATSISVDVDVPRPFNAIPRRVLERTGNAAVWLSLKYIQANFVDNLAKDYDKWATCLDYRTYRASLSEKEVVEEDSLLV